MARETNNYALLFIDNPVEISPSSRFRKWKDTTEEEMKVFVAIEIAMGLCSKNRLTDYWDRFWLTQTPSYTEVMPRDRYHILRSFLHFCDNEGQHPRGHDLYDPLYKIRPVIDLVKDTYLDAYVPHQEISVDEIMKGFKGRLSFKEYIPNKPKKWGIKIWSLCDSRNGFNLRW
ncbi:PREDICTED: piggyBac transposable element-derived protein 4-like [Priapulus caudatus]|uniref:PiggyBac transposable element-derived protein 4-like n=1 Tax=Priapulus caudatus TaxID=37621 RepID=A0ABM1DVG5_PRICU|nr:PREDICTED: piggyBac transposable element-derived protein 4-like [Priapulus caudatus]